MVKLELSRDETHTTKDWLKYIIKLARARLSISMQSDERWIATIVSITLLEDLALNFDKKLLNKKPQLYRFSFGYAHAAHFLVHLLALPIPLGYAWFIRLRQKICDEIHQQIFSMKQDLTSAADLSVSSFIDECLTVEYYEDETFEEQFL